MSGVAEDSLVETALKAYHAHWTRLAALSDSGRQALIERRHDCFEADTVARQKQLARLFYGGNHCRRMASRSREAVYDATHLYLRVGAANALSEYEDDPKGQRRFMRSLVTAEYVLLDSQYGFPDLDCVVDEESDEWDRAEVASYPAPVLYDDWYERSVGADTSWSGFIMKSTGEDFTANEWRWLDSAVQNTAWSEPFWRATTTPATRNRIHVYIYPLERHEFIECLVDYLRRVPQRRLVQLLRAICVALLEDDDFRDARESLPQLERRLHLAGRQTLLTRLENFLRKPSTVDALVVEVERIIDDLMSDETWARIGKWYRRHFKRSSSRPHSNQGC